MSISNVMHNRDFLPAKYRNS